MIKRSVIIIVVFFCYNVTGDGTILSSICTNIEDSIDPKNSDCYNYMTMDRGSTRNCDDTKFIDSYLFILLMLLVAICCLICCACGTAYMVRHDRSVVYARII